MLSAVNVWAKEFATLSPQPWAVWAATRTVVAGVGVGVVSLPLGGSIPSVAYFAVACATSFSVLGSPRIRVRNTAGQAVGAVAGLLVAGFTTGSPFVVAVVAVIAGFASGVVERVRDSAVTAGALMFLVTLAFGTFVPMTAPAPIQALWYVIGSAAVGVLAAIPLGRRLPAVVLPSTVATESRRQTLAAGARLAVCFGTGMILAMNLDQGRHSFWLPLTIAVVVRSEYGPVAARVTSRIAGTIVGAALASVVVLTRPTDVLLAGIAIAGMAFGALAAPRHYALAVIGITLSALLTGEIGLDDQAIPLLRLGDTLLGCLIALVLGHLLWLRRPPQLLRSAHE
ncbi:FUSC family protein [Compostimonas suwonensis]|uniref:Fusaric acid resistance family protein n=1 Tax=Compostimonas suwonensis TaxID=1048394 RepID=A0A2M9C3K3_9MICO|nr:FUSC family protein [Compostimonas suwonensis]PJJ65105.1 fusaric acid resistance family protein [Compostimonas suwonensis]